MIALLYRKSNNRIIGRMENVKSVMPTVVIGEGDAWRGIDLSEADYCILESSQLIVGDTLGPFTDVRQNLPPSQEDRIKAVEDLLLDMMLGGF